MRHAQGFSAAVDPLLPEPGNVWPGPIPPDKSLNDIQREQNSEQSKIDQSNPPPPPPRAPPRGSSTPPGSVQTFPGAPPSGPAPAIVAPQIGRAPSPLIGKNGPLIPDRNNGSGIGTATTPGQAGRASWCPTATAPPR